MLPLSRTAVLPLIRQALHEDAAHRDATSRAVIPSGLRIRARIVAKAPGVLAGIDLAAWTFQTFDQSIHVAIRRRDGVRVRPGDVLLTISGRARSILAAERTALNFLGHLSGIATLTAAFVQRVRGTGVEIRDTRKTLPGLRMLEKYAVRCGGGVNHRVDLESQPFIKTNHLRALQAPSGSGHRMSALIARLVSQAKLAGDRRYARTKDPNALLVAVEVGSLRELRAALRSLAAIILLDNWSPRRIREAVRIRRNKILRSLRWRPPFLTERLRHALTKEFGMFPPDTPANRKRALRKRTPLLEVSGGVTLDNVRTIASAGVHRISIGRLTHSAPALDVSLVIDGRT